MPEAKPAERVGDYEFLDLLAVGGMGQLWRVRHVKLGAIYVAKVLRPDLRGDPEFTARFLHEARLVANFRHPNVVQVFGFDEEHMLYFMEYVQGMDLDHLMRLRRNLEFHEKRIVIEVVADVVGHAHRHHNLIHRDIKPSNVLIAIAEPDDPILRSHVKLTDFGIARVMSIDQRVTMSSGVVMGTVHYMAPEQFEGHADKASDVYSIGVLYYQLLTGSLPFTGNTPFVLRDKHRTEIPPAPHKVNPSVPLADSATVMKCLEKDPANRFRDAAELYEHLTATMPTTHTAAIPRSRTRAARPTEVSTETGPLQPTAQMERTPRGTTGLATPHAPPPTPTPSAPLDQVTERTLPAALPGAPADHVTERTLPIAPRARPRPRRSLWVAAAIAVPAVIALAVAGVLLLPAILRRPKQPDTPMPAPTTVVPVKTKGDPFLSEALPSLAAARSLDDARLVLDRAAEQLAGDPKAAPRIAAVREGLSHLDAAAQALADGNPDEADRALRNAAMALGRLDGVDPGELPRDFLFRHTLATAIAQARDLAPKAAQAVEAMQPVADSKASIQYMIDKCKAAHAAVAEYLTVTPGCTAWRELRKKAEGGGSLEPLFKALPTASPPPIALARQYLAKLDALLSYAPTTGQDALYRAALLKHLDALAAAPAKLDPSPWLEACLPMDFGPGALPIAESLWREAHRTRLTEAARLCHALGSEQLAKAEALLTSHEKLADARRLFDDAEACLQAVRSAAQLPEDARLAATTLLSTSCARQAMRLFCLGPRSPEEEDQHTTEVRKLLDRGLDELPGCAPDVAAQARALRQMLKAVGDARARLAACLRENFAAENPYGGQPRTLFDALDAYECLARETAKPPAGPLLAACARATLEPFARLRAQACAGFALPNAAASWLLANALASAQKGRHDEARRFLAGFQLAWGNEAQGIESPLKRLLPAPLAAKAAELLKLVAAFAASPAPPAGAAAPEQWRKLWDQRLAAQPLLALDIPQAVAAGSLGPGHDGEEKQAEALYAQMRKLLDHYRATIEAEQALRAVEAQAEKLLIRGPDGPKPNPAAATREAVSKCIEALRALRDSGRHKDLDDHPARLAALDRDIGTLPAQAGAAEMRERVAALLAKSDPKSALDELRAGAAALGRMAELELTRQALGAWVKLAARDMAEKNHAAAADKFKAIRAHEQVLRHKDDPAVGATLDEIVKPLHYCEGQRALALGAQGLAAALAEFLQAAPYADAEAIAKQIAPLQEALKTREAQPFVALANLSQLLKNQELNPTIRSAAQKAARELETAFLTQAASCTAGFNAALAQGTGWEDFLDRTAITDEQVAHLKAFLAQAEAIVVEQPDAPPAGTLVADTREVHLKSRRVLKFRYRLPDAASVPMTLDQAVEWTLRYVPPERRKDKAWLIAGWRSE